MYKIIIRIKEMWKEGFSLFGGAQVAFRKQTRNTGHSDPWCPECQRQTKPAVTFVGPEAGASPGRES